MKTTTDWDPVRYLDFGRERTRPSLDLIAALDLSSPENILDVGCGPGNGVPGLAGRWPQARITGIDTSPAMVARAAEHYPSHTWRLQDARDLGPDDRFDLVFSNAVIQWIPDHGRVLPGLFSHVSPGGAMAVQVPSYGAMEASKLVDRVFPAFDRGRTNLNYRQLFTVYPPEFYDGLLRPRSARFDLWESTYFHVLESPRAIFQMLSTTGLKPYLDTLGDPADRLGFEEELVAALGAAYPPQPDGKVLFPFRRLFFIAYA
jgi:trans-aconitate 2-methyltransferase